MVNTFIKQEQIGPYVPNYGHTHTDLATQLGWMLAWAECVATLRIRIRLQAEACPFLSLIVAGKYRRYGMAPAHIPVFYPRHLVLKTG